MIGTSSSLESKCGKTSAKKMEDLALPDVGLSFGSSDNDRTSMILIDSSGGEATTSSRSTRPGSTLIVFEELRPWPSAAPTWTLKT